LEISFGTPTIRALCEKSKVAVKKLGDASARKLRVRLSALEAAERVTDLVPGHPHPLKGDRRGQFALDLDGGKRLVFTPDHEPYPVKEDGGIDWSQVTAVRIEFIGDYHE